MTGQAVASTSPPGPPARLPGGHLVDMLRSGPLDFLLQAARAYGDVVALRLGRQPVVLLSHPDLVRDVLVTHARDFHKWRGMQANRPVLGNGLITSEDPLHQRQRRLIQPAFHRQRVAAYAETMVARTEQASSGWRPGQTLDVHQALMRLTLDIVARTLFGADVEREAAGIDAAVRDVLAQFRRRHLPFGGLLERLPLPATRRFEQAVTHLDAVVYGMIDQRRASGQDGADLLATLLEARDAEHGEMTVTQVRDEVMSLLLAGHETTGNALTWALYLLDRHQEAERRLHAEVDEVLGGRAATSDDLSRLPFTRRVLAESMRLYPPVWAIGRRALSAYPVAGYTAPPGALVMMSQYVVHRDPRWYPAPERFDPDRWTPEEEARRPRFAYFPFGGGGRVCVGESFAWSEGILLLATLASRWRFRLVPGCRVVPQTSVTLRPRHGLPMRLERRGA